MSIQRLLSLRAARRRREQHFTSRRPGRTTAGWLACALALPALLALGLAWSLLPLVHDDLFWHLRTGEWIAAHHRVPLVDLFSYTRYGARWITHEWGFSLLSFLIFRAAGAGGLVLLTSALALATFAAVAWRALDLGGMPAGHPGLPADLRGMAAGHPGWPADLAADAGGEAGGESGESDDAPGAPGAALRPAQCLLLAALVALGMWAASPEIFLRAALAGELMLALSLAALTRYRRTGRRRWLVGVAALFWVWANLHSGVVFGLGVLALYALEPFLLVARRAGRRRRRRRRHRRLAEAWGAAAPYLWTLAAAVFLTLLNPNGLDAPLYPLLLARILFASGIPWELGHFTATAANGAGAGAGAALWLLVALLLLGLLPFRQARRVSPAEGASIALFLLATLASSRFVFDLVVIALPTVYKLLALPVATAAVGGALPSTGAEADARAAEAGAHSGPVAPSVPAPPTAAAAGLRGLAGRPALAAALVALFLLPVAPAAVAAAAAAWVRRPPTAGGLLAEPLPQAAARFVVSQGIAGPADRIFNHQNYGGFLGWRLRTPVFWDGRNDVFAELVREVATHPFDATASRYGVGYLMLAEHDYPGIRPDIAAGRWGLVFWDDFCAIYLRRGPRYSALLRRCELRLFPPFGGRPGLAALAADPRGAAAARAELAQVLAANPANQRALYFSGMISLYRGELRRGAAELMAARRIRPSDQVDRVLDRLRQLAARPPRSSR